MPLKVSHGECRTNIGVGERLAGRTDTLRSRLETSRSEQDVGSDDNVEGTDTLSDPIVGSICSFGDNNTLYQWVLIKPHPAVGDHKDRETMSLCDADCLRLDRTGIGIDIDLHSPYCLLVLAHRACPTLE
jgi:hypothetical protein